MSQDELDVHTSELLGRARRALSPTPADAARVLAGTMRVATVAGAGKVATWKLPLMAAAGAALMALPGGYALGYRAGAQAGRSEARAVLRPSAAADARASERRVEPAADRGRGGGLQPSAAGPTTAPNAEAPASQPSAAGPTSAPNAEAPVSQPSAAGPTSAPNAEAPASLDASRVAPLASPPAPSAARARVPTTPPPSAAATARAPGAPDSRPLAAASAADDLRRELEAVRRVELALREGHPRMALSILDRLDREIPQGKLHEERLASFAMARCAIGLGSRVALVREFTASYPESVYGERVARSCSEP